MICPVTNVLTVASVYGFMKKPMKSLYAAFLFTREARVLSSHLCSWSPGSNSMNTVHVDDVSVTLWTCAEWIGKLGRAEADKLAGEEIYFHNEKSKVSEVQGTPPADVKVIAPLFNLVSSLCLEFASPRSRSFIGRRQRDDAAQGGPDNDELVRDHVRILQLRHEYRCQGRPRSPLFSSFRR